MAVVGTTIWHGSSDEALAFLAALDHNCTCLHDSQGAVTMRCAGHAAMIEQRFLDHMVFARRLRERLLAEEDGRGRYPRRR